VNPLLPFFVTGLRFRYPHAHNLFLQVGVDMGLPGLVALAGAVRISLPGCVAGIGGQGGRGGHKVRPYMAGRGAGLLCSQVALAVHGLLDAATWGTRPAIIVWALWGMAMAACNLQARLSK